MKTESLGVDELKKKIDFSLKNGASFLAAFDADGTLWSKDAGYTFLKYQIKKRLIPGLPSSFDEFLNQMKGHSYDQTLTHMARINEGVSLEVLKKWVREILPQSFIAQFVFKEIKEVISFLLKRKVQVYIVTASLKWSVEPLAEYLKIPLDNILGVSNKIKKNLITGEIHQPIPWKEGKVKALFQRTKGKRPFLSAGNSINDFPLIETATHIKVAISSAKENTTNFESEQTLKQTGKKNGWKTFSFD